ncbi:MAG TPA: ATP-binding protein [Bacteroidales bacterium]|jgi:signal transduction histidine kinase|nr:ATP-binding protein [Bacteroidales bacterium]
MKPRFQIDRSVINLFNDYKYLDEIFIVMDFQGNIIASNKDSFLMEFFSKFTHKNFNFYDIIDKNYHKIIVKRLSELKRGKIVPPVEYKLAAVNGQSAYIEVFTQVCNYNNQRVLVSLVRDITVRKEIEKKLLYAVIQTEEKERQRFAQDLHDELGPFLSGLKLYLHELNSRDMSSQQKNQLIEYLSKMTNEAVDKIRSISSNLMPQNMIETGLAGNIEKTIHSLNQTGKIKISLKTNGTEAGLADSFVITIYRMVLELINNSLKHSKADKIDILLKFRKSAVNLVYQDNGCGFDLKKALKLNHGVGLTSIMNRIDLFQGTYSFRSQPNEGIEFDISFRLK